jgi:hypothetical protein
MVFIYQRFHLEVKGLGVEEKGQATPLKALKLNLFVMSLCDKMYMDIFFSLPELQFLIYRYM